MDNPEITVFGIRHHGPGSAHSLVEALEALQPEALLVEGPPEADELIHWAADPEIEPPVALLVYPTDQPNRAAFYPFAAFSPEWQALRFGATHGLPTRFIDLPLAHRFALQAAEEARQAEKNKAAEAEGQSDPKAEIDAGLPESPEAEHPGELALPELPLDPLGWIAQAAGGGAAPADGEAWWEQQVELRQDRHELFAAVLELMSVVRQELSQGPDPRLAQEPDQEKNLPGEWLAEDNEPREAAMRQVIREVSRQGYRRIAVVCGAWHAPALADMPPASQDTKLLKGLAQVLAQGVPKVKVSVTWTPWSYGRLSLESGYGAGIRSPGWYHHWFEARQAGRTNPEIAIGWMTRVAHLLRGEDLEASSASAIEAVRLAEALAALRGRSTPGLLELNEAAQAVFCFGDSLPLQLVHEKLIVGERLGRTPPGVPQTPLQADLAQLQRRLRLNPQAGQRDLDLDLRQPNDRERSLLLHRLGLLNIPWGQSQMVFGKSGTFHELWRLEWQPELAVRLVEASLWGNTVAGAASTFASHLAEEIEQLPALTKLLERVLPAGLPQATASLMQQLEDRAALSSDTGQLMDALPALASVLRYGDVRQTDTALMRRVMDGFTVRILIGLPLACASLNDEAAQVMYQRVLAVHQAIALLQIPEYLSGWQAALLTLSNQANLHGLLAGRCCRLLLDQGTLYPEEAARQMGLALSRASQPAAAAAWIEGFLRDSGAILIHDRRLWQVVDEWVSGIAGEVFTPLLPLLRRTFATFTAPERRQLGERLVDERTGMAAPRAAPAGNFDVARANQVLPVLRAILGVPFKAPGDTAGTKDEAG